MLYRFQTAAVNFAEFFGEVGGANFSKVNV